jgi:hypothetical protein
VISADGFRRVLFRCYADHEAIAPPTAASVPSCSRPSIPETVPPIIDFTCPGSGDYEDAFADKFVKRVDRLDPADRSMAQSSR